MKSYMNLAHSKAEAFVRAHQEDVWRFLRALGCDAAEADDLTQETFLRVFRSSFEYRSAPEAAAYLRQGAKHLFLSSLRKRKRARMIDNLDDVDVAWAQFAGEDGCRGRVEALKKCVESLPQRTRRALDLRYVHEASREEIARSLDLSDGGIKNLLERARKRLAECVERRMRRDTD